MSEPRPRTTTSWIDFYVQAVEQGAFAGRLSHVTSGADAAMSPCRDEAKAGAGPEPASDCEGRGGGVLR